MRGFALIPGNWCGVFSAGFLIIPRIWCRVYVDFVAVPLVPTATEFDRQPPGFDQPLGDVLDAALYHSGALHQVGN